MPKRRPGRLCRLLPYSILWAVLWSLPAHADETLWRRLADPDTFAIVRHALAPGFGDPDNFALGDCATQRNLDAAGRRQATAIGARFRAHGIARARVYSSEWCRCQETAELLDLGPVTALPALNSLHRRPRNRAPQMRALKAFLAAVDPTGPPVVLVSHQATMLALTGLGGASGEITVFRFENGAVEVLGQITPP